MLSVDFWLYYDDRSSALVVLAHRLATLWASVEIFAACLQLWLFLIWEDVTVTRGGKLVTLFGVDSRVSYRCVS
jgi:uncharacterized membrane protein